MKLAYSITEAAAALSVCDDTIYAHLKAGRLKAKKHGKRTLVIADSVRAFLESLPDYAPGDGTLSRQRKRRSMGGNMGVQPA